MSGIVYISNQRGMPWLSSPSVIGSQALHTELLELFNPPKNRLPSYSTIRRVLLDIDDETYGRCLSQFFQGRATSGEKTIAMDGKVSRRSYNRETPASTTDSHPAIQLVTVYIVERGLISPDSTGG